MLNYLQTEAEDAVLNKKRSTKAEAKYKKRQRFAKVDAAIDEQFQTSRLLGKCNQITNNVPKKIIFKRHDDF